MDGLYGAGWGIVQIDNTDEMTKSYSQSCGSYTDVCYRDDDYEADPLHAPAEWWEENIAGWICLTPVYPSTTVCDHSEILFDLHDLPGLSADQQHMAGCQETGHSVGLGHSTNSDSCMQATISDDEYYNTHDLSHINGYY